MRNGHISRPDLAKASVRSLVDALSKVAARIDRDNAPDIDVAGTREIIATATGVLVELANRYHNHGPSAPVDIRLFTER